MNIYNKNKYDLRKEIEETEKLIDKLENEAVELSHKVGELQQSTEPSSFYDKKRIQRINDLDNKHLNKIQDATLLRIKLTKLNKDLEKIKSDISELETKLHLRGKKPSRLTQHTQNKESKHDKGSKPGKRSEFSDATNPAKYDDETKLKYLKYKTKYLKLKTQLGL